MNKWQPPNFYCRTRLDFALEYKTKVDFCGMGKYGRPGEGSLAMRTGRGRGSTTDKILRKGTPADVGVGVEGKCGFHKIFKKLSN